MTSAEDIARVTGTKSPYQMGRDDERDYQKGENAIRVFFAMFGGVILGAAGWHLVVTLLFGMHA